MKDILNSKAALEKSKISGNTNRAYCYITKWQEMGKAEVRQAGKSQITEALDCSVSRYK